MIAYDYSTEVVFKSTQPIQNVWWLYLDMKHKRNESLKQEGKHKHKRKKDKKHKRRDKEAKRRRKEKSTNQRLKHLAMASGFQGACKSLGPSKSSVHQDEDDDIILVYDKHEEETKREGNSRTSKGTKFCLTKPFDMKPQDIPLPPENWVSNCKILNNSIRLEDIPLPPSPNTYDRLKKEKQSEIEDYEATRLEKIIKDYRKWEHTDLGHTMCCQDEDSPNTLFKNNSFTVMSYNVLAQDLLECHPYLYKKHDSKALQWKYRSATLWKEIKDGDADVLCLQEVQASHIDSFYNRLKGLGYQGIFKTRSNGHTDGCAIFYKSDKFKLVDSTTVEYYQDYLPVGCILDRHNVAIVVRLALQNSSGCENELVVATTHLLYNPRRHDVKLAQTQVLLAELDRMSYMGVDAVNGKPKYSPIIVTGDFNLQPDTAVYRLIVDGFLRYSDLAAKTLAVLCYGQPRQDSLLPAELEIANTCQHLKVVEHRFRKKNAWSKIDKQSIMDLSRLYNSDVYKSVQQYGHIQSRKPLLYEEDFHGRVDKGCLQHGLNFQSVYQHMRQASPSSKKMVHEATTHQNGWVTVDYIFYSGVWNVQKHCVEEGPLKLLSRYTLPTRGQCDDLKFIPNAVCGSDHLTLMARFHLNTE